MEKIMIIGAGGFALEVIDLINSINSKNEQFKIIGLLDDVKTGELINGLEILGKTSDLTEYNECSFVIAITNPKIREKYFHLLKNNNFKTPNLFHPNAEISLYAGIKEDSGVIINAFTQVSAKCKLCQGVIVDSNVYIGHESEIQSYVTVYPSSSISGNTMIGSYSEIGLGTNIIQGLRIGEYTFIGAGSTVISNIPSNVVAVGTPCKPIKER